jgi:hypothetical protein
MLPLQRQRVARRGSDRAEGPRLKMRIACLFAILGILSAPLPSGAWQLVDGRILQAGTGEPLVGAEIAVQLSGPPAVLRVDPVTVRSDSQGRFQVDLPRALPAAAWDRVEAVTFVAGVQGFRTRSERFRRPRLGRAIELKLEREGPDGAGAQQSKLDQLRSPTGTTIFVVADGAQGAAAETRNHVLAELGRAVRQHISTFVLAHATPEITVQVLDLTALGLDAGVPLGRVAERLNALLVVSGRTEPVAPAARGRPGQALATTVHLGVGAPGVPASYELDESVGAAGAAGVAELERVFMPRWARLAVIAWGAREFSIASRASDVQRLRALQQLMVNELRVTGRAGAEFVPQLQALQRASEDAIRRQGVP